MKHKVQFLLLEKTKILQNNYQEFQFNHIGLKQIIQDFIVL